MDKHEEDCECYRCDQYCAAPVGAEGDSCILDLGHEGECRAYESTKTARRSRQWIQN